MWWASDYVRQAKLLTQMEPDMHWAIWSDVWSHMSDMWRHIMTSNNEFGGKCPMRKVREGSGVFISFYCVFSHRYRQSNTLLFLVAPQKACIHDDGFRMTPKWPELLRFHQDMKTLLNDLNIQYHEIDFLDRESRVQFVLDRIREVKPRALANWDLQIHIYSQH